MERLFRVKASIARKCLINVITWLLTEQPPSTFAVIDTAAHLIGAISSVGHFWFGELVL